MVTPDGLCCSDIQQFINQWHAQAHTHALHGTPQHLYIQLPRYRETPDGIVKHTIPLDLSCREIMLPYSRHSTVLRSAGSAMTSPRPSHTWAPLKTLAIIGLQLSCTIKQTAGIPMIIRLLSDCQAYLRKFKSSAMCLAVWPGSRAFGRMPGMLRGHSAMVCHSWPPLTEGKNASLACVLRLCHLLY